MIYSEGFQPLKKYLPEYLKSFRFRNRAYNKFDYLFDYLTNLGIHRKFNTKRGSKAGRLLKSSNFQLGIKTLSHNVRRPKPVCFSPRPPCYKVIQTERNYYNFPSFFVTNLRSISNKFEQLGVAMEVYNPDIVLISETWINNQNKDAYNINGYRSIHRLRDRPDKTHGGGVSAYVRNSLSIQQVLLSPDPNLEVISFICKPNYLPREIPWIGFILIYFPPNDLQHESKMVAYILAEYDRLLSINCKACIFISGDFNSLDNQAILQLHNMRQIVSFPTRGSNCLDMCFSNVYDRVSVRILPAIATSDHKLLLISPLQHTAPASKKIVISYRKKTASGYRTMANVLCNHNWNQWNLIDSVQEMADLFYDFLNILYCLAFPLVSEIKRSNSHPWMTSQIISLIKKRDSLADSSNCDSTYFRTVCDSVKSEIAKAKNTMCRSLYHKYKSSPKDFYRLIKSVTNSNANKFCGNIAFPDTSICDSLAIICEFFNKLLNRYPDCDPICESLNNCDSLPKMELFKVYNQLKNLPNSNACSPGEIPIYIYKELAEFLAEPILMLFNKSLEKSFCPDQWKSGFLITIPKVSIVRSPDQLRPIVITSPLAKIIERHILASIIDSCGVFLDPMQFGGMGKRSSCQYLVIYLHRVILHLESRNTSVTSIFTDFAKAFDSVDHNTLMQIMINLSINSAAVKWIYSFLFHRKTTLRNPNLGDSLSFNSSCGVPQGSVLGGFLFILLVNDLMSSYPFRLKYIDDLTISIMDSNRSSLSTQLTLDDLAVQSTDLKLILNINKCFLMTHSFSKLVVKPTATLSESQLNHVDSFKLLGVIIQSDLKWGSHVKFIIGKANMKLHLLYVLRRLGANRDILTDTYLTFIRPILEYCAPAWHSALNGSQIKAIEQVQKRIVRIILANDHTRYSDDLVTLGLPTLETRRIELHTKFAFDFFNQFPDFMPKSRIQTTGISTRNSFKLTRPSAKTSRALKSPIFSFINAYNIATL